MLWLNQPNITKIPRTQEYWQMLFIYFFFSQCWFEASENLLSFAPHLKQFLFIYLFFHCELKLEAHFLIFFQCELLRLWGFCSFFDFVTPWHLKKSDICEFIFWCFFRLRESETHSYTLGHLKWSLFNVNLIVSWEFKDIKKFIIGRWRKVY